MSSLGPIEALGISPKGTLEHLGGKCDW